MRRGAALRGMPDLVERFYPGWQGLGWRQPDGGLLGTLFARDEDVGVYLERGAELPDPFGLLGGAGRRGAGRLRRTRTLTFRPKAATPTATQLVEYLDLALDHAVARRR
jgi:hypothetical protein